MAQVLSEVAQEKATYVITASFEDHEGVAVTPTAITWTLTKEDGTVVNSREDVSVTPASSITIVLSASDLAILDSATEEVRVLLIEATYDDMSLVGLPIKEEVRFAVRNLVGVS